MKKIIWCKLYMPKKIEEINEDEAQEYYVCQICRLLYQINGYDIN